MHLTRRQKEILDYLGRYIERRGYAPTIEEIGEHFGLSSLATVHKHLTNLQEKGLVKRAWNRSRALELLPTHVEVKAVELPLLGRVAAGTPVEAVQGTETIFVPEDMSRAGRFLARALMAAIEKRQPEEGQFLDRPKDLD